MSKKKPVRRAPAKSTALVRRLVAPKLSRRRDTKVVLESKQQLAQIAGIPLDQGVLGEEAALGARGRVEIKLTKQEELILSMPVDPSAVLIKPTGQPYLSHPTYTQWFNRAFGRLGWAIVPKAKPRMADKTLSCPYVLYIHGKPAAFAMGRNTTRATASRPTVTPTRRRWRARCGAARSAWAWASSSGTSDGCRRSSTSTA